MQFYFVYGPLLFWASRRMAVACLIVALALAPVLRAAASVWLQRQAWESGDSAYAIYAGSSLHIDAFAAGALLAFAARSGWLDRVARPVVWRGARDLRLFGGLRLGELCDRGRARSGRSARRRLRQQSFGQHREIFLYSGLSAAGAGLVALAATRDRWVRLAARSSGIAADRRDPPTAPMSTTRSRSRWRSQRSSR